MLDARTMSYISELYLRLHGATHDNDPGSGSSRLLPCRWRQGSDGVVRAYVTDIDLRLRWADSLRSTRGSGPFSLKCNRNA
jgi:hypothetical protein